MRTLLLKSTLLQAARFGTWPTARLLHWMKSAHHIRASWVLVACFVIGCRLFSSDHPMLHGQSPLRPASASPDSVAMEIIWARFPADDPVLDDAAWRDIDEMQIDPAVRRELVSNGLRAGIISGSLPPAVDRVLHQSASRDSPAEDTTIDRASAPKTQNLRLLAEPIVHGRNCRLRRNQRFEIQASEQYPSLPLLVSGGAELSGRTYEQAEAIYALRVDPRPDRTATIELTPELHHGTPRLRYSGSDGAMLQTMRKEREVFDRLHLSVKLAPGEMLVLMSMPDSGSRLGHYFHTAESVDGPQQKLILIRLAQVPPSDTFAERGDR